MTSIALHFAVYSGDWSNPSFPLVDHYGWNPSWRTVEEIRGWAEEHSNNRYNMEVFAGDIMLSQLAQVKMENGMILVTPRYPNRAPGTPISIQRLDIFVH